MIITWQLLLFFEIVVEIFPLPGNWELAHSWIFSIEIDLIGIGSDVGVFQIKNGRSSGGFYHHFDLCIFFIRLVGPRARLNFDAFAQIFWSEGFTLGLGSMFVDMVLTRPHLILISKFLKFILVSNRLLIFIVILVGLVSTRSRNMIVVILEPALFVEEETFFLIYNIYGFLDNFFFILTHAGCVEVVGCIS